MGFYLNEYVEGLKKWHRLKPKNRSQSCYIMCLGVYKGRTCENTQTGRRTWCLRKKSRRGCSRSRRLEKLVWRRSQEPAYGCHTGTEDFLPKARRRYPRFLCRKVMCSDLRNTEITLAAVWSVWWGWGQREQSVDSGKLVTGCYHGGGRGAFWTEKWQDWQGGMEGSALEEGSSRDVKQAGEAEASTGQPVCSTVSLIPDSHSRPVPDTQHFTSWMIRTVLVQGSLSVTVLYLKWQFLCCIFLHYI